MPGPTTGLMTTLPRLYLGVQQDSLTAVVAPTVGQAFELPSMWDGLPDLYDWEVVYPSAPTTPSVQLEGSDDPAFSAANTFIIDGPYTGTTNTERSVAGRPIRFLRANCTAIAGGSVTVRIKNAGKQ